MLYNMKMILIKKTQQSVFCRRCGDQLSQDEILTLTDDLCVLCDHMHIEALETRANRLASYKKRGQAPKLFIV